MPRDVTRLLPRLSGLSRRRLPAPGRACAEHRPAGCQPAGIEIPVCGAPPEQEARATLKDLGCRLVRQERWAALDAALREADSGRQLTPAGHPAAQLLCDGAVQDVAARATEAVHQGDAEGALEALSGFIASLGPTTHAPYMALLAASAHITTAWLWRDAPTCPLPEAQRGSALRDHMDAAHLLLRPHPPSMHDSAALAAARCAVIEVLPDPAARLAADFEALIAADPACPEHLRAYGRALRPDRLGTWPELDRTARRLAMVTRGTWGSGAYAWMWFDALSSRAEALSHVDTDLFAEGLHDILEGCPGRPVDAIKHQNLANLFAGWCAALPEAPAGSGTDFAQLSACLDWIVTDHLRELHPELWGHGASQGSSQAGTDVAHAVIGDLFADQLARGRSVVFTAQGIALRPAGSASCTLAPCAALAYPRRNLRDEDPPCLT